MDFEPITVFIEWSGEYMTAGGWTDTYYREGGKLLPEWRWSVNRHSPPAAVDCQLEMKRRRGWTEVGAAPNVAALQPKGEGSYVAVVFDPMPL